MKILIIYAHPDEESFNRAVLEKVKSAAEELGHEVRVKDLYAENFNPVLSREDLRVLNQGGIPESVCEEQRAIEWAQSLVFIYPVWWHDKPAILRGWIDRVLVQGFAYDLTATPPKGLLKHKKALVFMTTGAPEVVCQLMRTKQKMIWAIRDAVLGTCGIRKTFVKIFYAVPSATDEKRSTQLEEASQFVQKHLARNL